MAERADGSIVVDVDLDAEGFRAGSAQLQKAVKSFASQAEKLGPAFQKAMSGNMSSIAAFNGKAQLLENTMAGIRKEMLASAGDVAATGESEALAAAAEKAEQEQIKLQKAIEATEDKLEKAKASAQGYYDAVAKAQASTDEMLKGADNGEQVDRILEMEKLELEQIEAQYASQVAKVKELTASLEKQKERLAELPALAEQFKTQAEQAMIPFSQTEWYQQMAQGLKQAMSDLAQLRNEIQQANSAWAQMPTLSGYISNAFQGVAEKVKSVSSTIGTAFRHPLQAADRIFGSLIQKAGHLVATMAKFSVNKIVSGIRSAASGLARMASHSRDTSRGMGGVLAAVKRLAPAMLAAQGVMGMLRKAVNAYMQENQQLSNTMNACWSSIGNMLGPIIERLVNLVAMASAYFTQFLQLLGFVGKGTSSAISAAGGAASGAAKKLERQLASFDELNILSDSSSDSGGGGGGGAGDMNAALPQVELPDWAKLMVDQLKAGNWTAAATTLAKQLNIMVGSVDWAGIGNKVGYYLNGALTFLATFITTFDWMGLGSDLATSVNSVLNSVDWGNLGTVLSGKFRAIILTAAGFFLNLDWVALASAFNDFAISFFNGITDAIAAVDWQQIGRNVADFLRKVDWSGISDALFKSIGAALGALAAFMWGLIEDAWNEVVGWWYDVAYEDGSFTIEGLLRGIWDAIKNIGTWIYEHIAQPFINGFKEAFGIHSPSTVMAEQGVLIIQGLLQGITGAWHSIVEFFSSKLSSIGQTISTAWSNVKSWTSSTWSNVKNTVDSAWDSMKSTASSIGSNIVSKVSDTYTNVKDYITDKLTSAKDTASSAWDSMKSTASSVGSSIASKASSAFTQMKSSITEKVNSAKTAATTGWNNMKTAITSAAANMSSTVSSKFSAISSTVSSKISSATSTIKTGFESARSSIVSKMQSAMNTISGQDWRSVGSNICAGISNGINAGWAWLKNTVGNMASNLLKSAKSALGIHSPSVLFKKIIGLNIGYGIGEGITDSQPAILKTVTGVAGAIADGFQKEDYAISPISVDKSTGLPNALNGFSDTITDSFTMLLDRLEAIAQRVTFTMPAVAGSVVPYQVASAGTNGNKDVSESITASNEELGSVVIQVVSQAAAAIVRAIEENSGGGSTLDRAQLLRAVKEDLSRETKMRGRSPLPV